MAVFTRINTEELENHLQNYNIGKLINFSEIIDGIDNSNFIIKTTQGKFIFTIFESRINKNELPYFINLKQFLSNQNIPCPTPIKNQDGENIADFKNKKSSIVTFLNGKSLRADEDGYYRNITANHCSEVGEHLAKMHIASPDFSYHRNNDLNIIGIEKLFSNFRNLLKDYDDSLTDLISKSISQIYKNWNSSLLSAPCHLDLFPDNVFFNDNAKLSAIIDFYFSANDLLIYDFAIAVNAWCFDVNSFNYQKFNSLVKSYNQIRKLPEEEINFLDTALICASLRFLTTRLFDYFNTPKDTLIKIKDPQEYKQKLIFFLENKITC